MAKNSVVPRPVDLTPGDEAPHSPMAQVAAAGTAPIAEPRRKVPNRGIKKRVLGEGEGDYCIYEIAGSDGSLPKGTLLPLPAIPRFKDTADAMKWIRNESADLLAGKQVMIFKACEILSLVIQTKPTVVIQSKPKVTVTRPETSNG